MFPIHIQIGDSIHYFFEGGYFLMAILAAFIVCFRLNKAFKGLENEKFFNLLFVALISGIVGGRLFHQLFYEDSPSFLSVIQIWKGGMSITGAVVLGPIFTYAYCRFQKIDFWRLFAIVTPGVLLGQAVGRFGCFLNGDAHGIPTKSILGVSFPKTGTLFPSGEKVDDVKHASEAWVYSLNKGLISLDAIKSAPVHPTQLYEAILNLIVGFSCYWMLKQKMASKKVVAIYVVGYCVLRTFIEFFRADSEVSGYLSSMQWVLVMISVAITALMLFKKNLFTEN